MTLAEYNALLQSPPSPLTGVEKGLLVVVGLLVGFSRFGASAVLIRSCREPRLFIAGAALLGVALGFRPQSLTIGIVPLLVASRLAARRSGRFMIAGWALCSAIVVASYGGAARHSTFMRASSRSETTSSQITRCSESAPRPKYRGRNRPRPAITRWRERAALLAQSSSAARMAGSGTSRASATSRSRFFRWAARSSIRAGSICQTTPAISDSSSRSSQGRRRYHRGDDRIA